MRRLIVIATLLAVVLVAGCAGAPARPSPTTAADDVARSGGSPHADPGRPVPGSPLLRLAPSALPGGLALQQRLTFRYGDRSDTVDALVEADARSVRVLVHMQGQVALRLVWDGETLRETRADWLPPQLQGERVLSDLQFVYWPAEAIDAALPPEWTLTLGRDSRFLVFAPSGQLIVGIHYLAGDVVELRSMPGQPDFELRIESAPVTP